MTSKESINKSPDMANVNFAFDPELRQAQQDWDNYLENSRETQGYIDGSGRLRSADGKFKAAESDKKYRNRLYDESMDETSREGIGLVSLAKAAREANLSGDKTTFLNIQDDIQDRLIESSENNGWSSEQTDAMLGRLISIMHGGESPSAAEEDERESDEVAPSADAEGSGDDEYGPHQVYGPHLNESIEAPEAQLDESSVDATPISDEASEEYGPHEVYGPHLNEASPETPLDDDDKDSEASDDEPSSGGEPAGPRVRYWSGNSEYSSDPNRIPYHPTESRVDRPVARDGERSPRRLGRIKKLGRKALGVVLAVGLIVGASEILKNDNDDEAPVDTAIELEATPVSTPGGADFEIVDELVEPVAMPPASTPASEAAPSPVDLTESVSTPSADIEIIEPQSPVPDAAPEEVDEPIVPPEASNSTAEVEPTAIEPISDEADLETEVGSGDIESSAGATEALMVGVEVAPGDGVTQVLSKVFANAGYPDMSPEQLFTVYEELVANPSVGPDSILEGVTLEYNEEAGEYWIQGEGNTEAHLTQEAAEWLVSIAP